VGIFFAKVCSKSGIWVRKNGKCSQKTGFAQKNLGIEVENLEIAPKLWD
jgi:hypothetical protein